MATIRPDTINLSTAPSLSNKALPSLLLVSKPEQRRSAPRLDAEPLYNAIKTAISDADWSFYKASISAFLLGNLNQEELTQRLDGILSTPALEHAHNQFILGIFGNLTRDAPELGVVASWADDKVVGKGSSGAGKGGAGGKGGDEEEKRLKTEIMMLPRRERKRLKMVVDHGKGGGDADGRENWMGPMNEYFDARRAKMPDIGPASAGGFQKTNWDIEILKRYQTPLFTETHEFPDANSIAARMLPISYESGLPSGHTAECASLVNLATEVYIKEALSNFFTRVSSNGPGYVRTAEFKRRIEREEEKVMRGELGRGAAGLLPGEVEEMRKRRPLCMEDLRLALHLGDPFLGHVPIMSSQILNETFLDTHGIEDVVGGEGVGGVGGHGHGFSLHQSNGLANGLSSGYHFDLNEPAVAEDEWSWAGGSVQDLDGLDAVLDGCLAVGL